MGIDNPSRSMLVSAHRSLFGGCARHGTWQGQVQAAQVTVSVASPSTEFGPGGCTHAGRGHSCQLIGMTCSMTTSQHMQLLGHKEREVVRCWYIHKARPRRKVMRMHRSRWLRELHTTVRDLISCIITRMKAILPWSVRVRGIIPEPFGRMAEYGIIKFCQCPGRTLIIMPRTLWSVGTYTWPTAQWHARFITWAKLAIPSDLAR